MAEFLVTTNRRSNVRFSWGGDSASESEASQAFQRDEATRGESVVTCRKVTGPDTRNTVSGTVTGHVVQAQTIEGGIHIGRRRK